MRASHSTLSLLAAVGLAGSSAFADDAQPEAPDAKVSTGPCAAELYRGFDFWLGTWSVADGEGAVQGINRITSEESGCVIVERWTSANGGTGQSYNYIDPATGNWRQVWVSAGLNIDYEGGLTETGSMRLEGTITYRSGAQFPFTGEWTPQTDGTVRQYFEQYNPNTDAWDPWFLGIYTRVEGDTGG
ncbi:MAG: hypothetical protein AAGJ50_13895 [Pseudomonadota bacterium]